jgi:serine phosphatase RsbU (regulator of sigma subunit)
LIFISCQRNHTPLPEITKGFIDLSKWSFEKDGTIDLNGEWEFYWHNLLEPNDFRLNYPMLPEYIYVPGGWVTENKKGEKKQEFGYGTYRLRIKVPDNQTNYMFVFSSIFSSAKVWINNKFISENGKVASTKENSIPRFLVNFIYKEQVAPPKNDTIEIIVQVADFYKGGPYAGIKRHVTFGSENQIYKYEYKIRFTEAFLLGMLLLFAIYHLFIFFNKRDDFAYLIFGLMCLDIVLRIIYTSGMFIDFFTYNNYNRIGFYSWGLSGSLIITFFYFLYKKEIIKIVVMIFIFVALILLLIASLVSANGISKLDKMLVYYAFAVFIFLLSYALIRTIIRKREGSILAYLGSLILFATAIHDYFFAMGKIIGFGKYMTEIGFGSFVLFQALNLGKTFSYSLKKNISLNAELEFQNANLEAIVNSRTKTIEDQKRSLEEQNKSLNLQKTEIQKQNEDLFQKNKEITDSINYGKRIQSALLTPETYISELLHENFILYKPKDIVSGDFYWIKQVNQYIIVAAVDCTGHGVPGAFMSMLGLSFLNEIIQRREITQANQILNELRSQVKYSLRQHGQRDESKDGMDIALCVIDLKNKLIQFSGANNPLYVIREINGSPEFIEIKGDRMPIGFYHGLDKTFTNHELRIEMGDTIYIFTDGFIDQIGGKKRKKFLSINFKNLLLENYLLSMHEQKVTLDETIQEWMDGQPQTDDILVIGIRF